MKQFFTILLKIKPIYLILFVVSLLISILSMYASSRTNERFLNNTTIVKSKGAYAYKNTTNEFQTQFKTKPTDVNSIVFKNDLGGISFYTFSNQSFGEINSDNPPITDGSTLTYPEIFPQIDLRYTISSSRLLEEFIVKDAATAAQINRIEQRAKTDSTYKKNNDGSVTFSNKDKTVFTLPHPVMYETGNTGVKSAGIVYEIKKDQGQLIITKIITEEGQKWLADPKRVYPIAIDLVIDNADTSSNWVSSDPTATTVSQETTIKQEGSGSVKIQTTAEASTTIDLMEYSSNGTAQASFVTNSATANATGGTITSSGGYTIHTFTSSGTFTPPAAMNVEVLVVAGGGGGGSSIGSHGGGGGGGAGGFIYNAAFATTPQVYTVTVGNGGSGGAQDAGQRGQNGGNSVFSTITATGGGGGGDGVPTNCSGLSGGSGGGAGYNYYNGCGGGSGTTGQGYSGGGNGATSGAGGGGGGGAGGAGSAPSNSPLHNGGTGGVGLSNSITGSAVFYAGGGGGGQNSVGGNGGGGNGGVSGTANTGGGGGGWYAQGGPGGNGGSGIVIIRYIPSTNLQSYSEPTLKSEGSYALKGVANITTSLNKTLTRTIGSPINLSNINSVTFDLRASRTGSNIKVGLHDSGGTTTEVTPNITSADTFQSATIDLSGVTNANKDAIDQIIITIVNADATNTFYLDNMAATAPSSLNDTVTRTTAATDLSTVANITYWVRSSVAGSYATFGFGESAATEQTQAITINQANTWEQKSWNITGITGTSRDAVTKYAFTFTGDTSGASFYFDDIQTNALFAPTLGTGTGLTNTSIRWNFTDNSTEETGFKVYDSTGTSVLATCASANLTYCDETGLSPNTQYTRKIGTYNASSTSITSNTVSGYTLAAIPGVPAVSTRTTTTVNVNPDLGTNSAATTMAIYKETGTTCDGSGGSYIAANGSDNGATAVWQTDAIWSTITITGLNSETAYAFCVKAKNGNNVETAFSAIGSYNAGFIPLSGNYICTQDTVSSNTFTNRYVDGSNAGRYVIALDSGTGVTNSAVFEAKSCIMTLNSTDTLVAGSLNLTGGSIAIASGGQIKIGQPVWAIDADADGYTADTKLYVGSQPTNGRRKNLITTLGTADCGDSTYSTSNVCCTVATRYQDADGDTYGNPSVSISACPTAGYVDNASDCYDSNANAKPGSTTCSATNRGDGSYDYNCSSTQTNCGTTLTYSATPVYVSGQQGLGSCNQGNDRCGDTSNNTYWPASIGCGQTGAASCTAWQEQVGGVCLECGGTSGGYQWPCVGISAPTGQTCQ